MSGDELLSVIYRAVKEPSTVVKLPEAPPASAEVGTASSALGQLSTGFASISYDRTVK